MSYCVNCGVELDPSLKSCPLCHTPVINPNELKKEETEHPYPTQKGQVEVVKRKDLGILLSIVVLATSATCILLNLFVFPQSAWSVLIVGACVILWTLLVPFVIYSRLPIYVSILLDAMAVGIYLYMLTYLTSSRSWFFHVALPILILIWVLVEQITVLFRHLSTSILAGALYLFIAVPVLCIGIEIIVDLFLTGSISLTWSMIVLTVCVIIDIALVTVISRSRLRNAVRRRLHF